MAVEIHYERDEKSLREPTLEVLADGVSLSVPLLPRWLELSILGVECAVSTLWFVVCVVLCALVIHFQIYPRATVALLLCAVLFLMVTALFSIIQLLARARRRSAPRRLELLGGALHHSYQGAWRIKRRVYPLSEVRSIRLKPIKGLLGKPAGAVLIVQVGRWRKIRFRFGRKWIDLAATSEREFRRAMLPSSA